MLKNYKYIIFILGLECLPTVNLPAGCFCTSGPTPTPYIPLVDVLEELSSKATPVRDAKDEPIMDCSSNSKGRKNNFRRYIIKSFFASLYVRRNL